MLRKWLTIVQQLYNYHKSRHPLERSSVSKLEVARHESSGARGRVKGGGEMSLDELDDQIRPRFGRIRLDCIRNCLNNGRRMIF